MVRRDRLSVRTKVAAALMALGAGVYVTVAGPSSADVTAVTGSAYGYLATNVTFINSPQPDQGPAPTVTLPAGGSATPVTASADSVDLPLAITTLFSSGTETVSTQGTTAGSVTSSADIQSVNASGQEAFTADSIASTCTASESATTGSTTVAAGATVQTFNGDGTNPAVTVPVPTNPAPNTAIEGSLFISPTTTDTFTYVFNEQITNADGSLTVNAFHEILRGPTAKGDLFVGQSVCGVTGAGPTTTTSTTLVPSSTTTTSVPAGVITPGGGGTVGGGGSVSGGGNALVRTGTETSRMTVLAAAALFLGFCLLRAARFRRYAAPWDRRGRW